MLNHMLLFSPVGKNRGLRSLLALAVLPQKKDDAGKVILYLLLFSVHPNLYFLLQKYAGLSQLETLSSSKALSSVSDCLRWCFLGDLGTWPRGPGDSSQVSEGSTTRTEVCMPLVNSVGG